MFRNEWVRKMFYIVEIFLRHRKNLLHINKEIKTKQPRPNYDSELV